MLQAARKHVRSVAMLGVAAALVVGGVAAAQGGSSGNSQDNGSRSGKRLRAHPGRPPLGPQMKGLTYAEFHVQNKDGEAAVIRLDQGRIKAVDSSSITLTENDGSEVTIAVDSSTGMVGEPGTETTLSDLSVGQRVSVSGPDGGTAKVIVLAPGKGAMKGAPHGGKIPAGGPQGSGRPQGPGGPQGSGE